jgi:ADP-ribose pyrophosphatase YjhB (NUDIX family)
VTNERNEVLVMTYRYGQEEVWALPGGNRDEGESLTTTLQREIEEELAVTVAVGSLRWVMEISATPQLPETLHVIFDANLMKGTPILQPRHTRALQVSWQSAETLASGHLYPNIPAQTLLDPGPTPFGYLGRFERKWVP